MIDPIYAKYSLRKEKPLDHAYKPSDAILGRKFYDAGNNKLAVIFPGWHTHNFPVNILAKRLKNRGWSVLVYDYNDQIMEPEEIVVVESLKYVRDKTYEELTELVSVKPYRKIHFISLSLGGVPMALVCNKFKHFSHVTAVVGGDDLAICMWYGARTKHYRDAFRKMNIGIRKLSKKWDGVGPDHNLSNFKGKEVKLVISRHDSFVPTVNQQKLAEKLKKAGAVVKINTRRTGHIMTIARYCLFDNPV